MTGHWSAAWGIAWGLSQLVGVIGTALILNLRYREAATSLFRAEGQLVPAVRNVAPGEWFSVLTEPAPRVPWIPRIVLRRLLVSPFRIALYCVAGLLTLYCVQALFLTAETLFDGWLRLGVAMSFLFTALLILGRLGIAASGVWFFSLLVGIAAANFLFAFAWLAVYGVYPALFEGLRGWLTIAFGTPFVLFLSWLAFLVVYAVARFALSAYHALASHLNVSPAWMSAAVFWAFIAYLFLPHADHEIEWYERLAKFYLAPLVIYIAISLPALILVSWLSPRRRCARLLYLRSFAYRSRSERLFRSLATNWTEIGPVYALNGPDIVNATLDAKALSALLGSNLEDAFISNTDQVLDRLKRVHDRPGWDGLYRVEEFKCKGSVWPDVFRTLLERCDVVVMDLRGFKSTHSGTLYELMTIIEIGAIGKILFLRDDRTDVRAIENIGNTVLSNSSEIAVAGHIARMSLTETEGGNLRASRIALHLLFEMLTNKRGPVVQAGEC